MYDTFSYSRVISYHKTWQEQDRVPTFSIGPPGYHQVICGIMWPFVLWSGCLHCGWAVCMVLGLFRLCMGCFLGCSHCNLSLHCLPCAGWLMSFLGCLCHGWVVCTVLGLLLCLGAICAIHGVFALSVGHECHAQAVFIVFRLFTSSLSCLCHPLALHVVLELFVWSFQKAFWI